MLTAPKPNPLPNLLQLVMRQAEVPGRVADDRELGRAFVYDSGLFQRRLGSVMMAQLDALHGLSGAGWQSGTNAVGSGGGGVGTRAGSARVLCLQHCRLQSLPTGC